MIERVKGGVKLFVGRLPREVTQRQLHECFEEFGEVVEVFVIGSQAASGVGCAFIRMATLEQAENAIQDLHEQRVLIPEQRELGPMQVAFAKGEALRLGLNEKEEILPSYKEARMKVVEHKEKREFFEAMQKQQEVQHEAMAQQHLLVQMAAQSSMLPKDELVLLIKDGQRSAGQTFKQKWWSYCDQGLSGIRDYDPSHHPQEVLAQFVGTAAYEYGNEPWFKSRFEDLPLPPPGAPLPPPPFGMPGMGMPPGMGPPGMGPMGMPPGMGMPGMLMPGMPHGMPPHMGPPGMGPPDMRPPHMPLPHGPGMGLPHSPSRNGAGRPGQEAGRDREVDASSEESGSEVGCIEDINNDDI